MGSLVKYIDGLLMLASLYARMRVEILGVDVAVAVFAVEQ
jgi:hypothetical protein